VGKKPDLSLQRRLRDDLRTQTSKAFGDEFFNVWPEIWQDIEPLVCAVDRGEAKYLEDLKLIMNRNGFDEETFFTFSYSPIRNENGEVCGLLCACVLIVLLTSPLTAILMFISKKIFFAEQKYRNPFIYLLLFFGFAALISSGVMALNARLDTSLAHEIVLPVMRKAIDGGYRGSIRYYLVADSPVPSRLPFAFDSEERISVNEKVFAEANLMATAASSARLGAGLSDGCFRAQKRPTNLKS
jgi:hypothetical protein